MATTPINPDGAGHYVVDDWELVCLVCHCPVSGFLLVEQTQRLVRHLVNSHPFEAAVLARLLARDRARAYASA